MYLLKAHIHRHLAQEARGCTYLVLWLDCDREGENICFEGIIFSSAIYVHHILSSSVLEIRLVYKELYMKFIFVRFGLHRDRNDLDSIEIESKVQTTYQDRETVRWQDALN